MINYKEKIKKEDILVSNLHKKRFAYFDEINEWRKDLIKKNYKEVFKHIKTYLNKDYVVDHITKDGFSIYKLNPPLDSTSRVLLAKILFKPPHIEKEILDKYVGSFQIQTEGYKDDSDWEYERLITLGKICKKLKSVANQILKKINNNCDKVAQKIKTYQQVTILKINQRIEKKSDYIQTLKYKEVLNEIKAGKSIKFKKGKLEFGGIYEIKFRGGVVYSIDFEFKKTYTLIKFEFSDKNFHPYKVDNKDFFSILEIIVDAYYYQFIYE